MFVCIERDAREKKSVATLFFLFGFSVKIRRIFVFVTTTVRRESNSPLNILMQRRRRRTHRHSHNTHACFFLIHEHTHAANYVQTFTRPMFSRHAGVSLLGTIDLGEEKRSAYTEQECYEDFDDERVDVTCIGLIRLRLRACARVRQCEK